MWHRSTFIAVALLVFAAGCFETPKPECAFLCGEQQACPEGYACAADGWCKRDDVDPVATDCGSGGVAIDATPRVDGPTADASLLDASLFDATPFDATAFDAAPMFDAMPPMFDAMTPVCGDGIVTSPEVCDDFNSGVCGTCSSDCMTAQPASGSTGSITAVLGVADGETFTIGDGFSAPTVFEFDTDMSFTGVRVDISGVADVTEVRDAMLLAINGVGASLLVTGTASGIDAIDLASDMQGVVANQPIMETVGDAGFVVTDMTGGVAYDCAMGVGCGGPEDCNARSCTANVCD